VPGIGEHRLRELEIGFRQCIASEAGKVRCLIVADLEPIGIRVLQASNGRGSPRVLDTFVEPKRDVVAALVERLGCGALLFGGKDSIRGCGEKVANLFCDRAVGSSEAIGSAATIGSVIAVGLDEDASVAFCSAGVAAAGKGAVLSASCARHLTGTAARIRARAVPARIWS
jgi:hypothetical protein